MLLLKTKRPSTLTGRNVPLSNLLISSRLCCVIFFLEIKKRFWSGSAWEACSRWFAVQIHIYFTADQERTDGIGPSPEACLVLYLASVICLVAPSLNAMHRLSLNQAIVGDNTFILIASLVAACSAAAVYSVLKRSDWASMPRTLALSSRVWSFDGSTRPVHDHCRQ